MDGVALAFGAEAVIDEVDLLEAALRGAAGRNHLVPQHKEIVGPYKEPLSARTNHDALVRSVTPRDIQFSGDGTDVAEMAYGLQLKAWIDMQVDRRVEQLNQSIVESRLAAVREGQLTSIGDSRRLERDVDALKDTQARLVAVAQDISDELAHVKLQADKDAAAVKRLADLYEERSGPTSKIEDRSGVLERLMSQEAALLEVRRLQAELQQGVQDLQGRSKLINGHDRQERNLSELHLQQAETQSQQQQLAQQLRSTTSCFEETQRKAADVEDVVQQLEQRTLAWRAEIRKELTAEASSRADLGTRLETMRQDVLVALEDGQQGLEDLRNGVGTEVGALQKLMQELRAEMEEAFKTEATAVATLDREVCKTRRELDRRIDELLQAVTDRRSGKLICSPPAESSSNTVISPRTREIVDAAEQGPEADSEKGAARPSLSEQIGRVDARPRGVLRFGRPPSQ